MNPGELSGDETEFDGPYGWARKLKLHDGNQRSKFGIASWLLFAPHAHPLWSYHTLDIVHLRTLPDEPAPVLRFRDATHELLVISLNPEDQPYTIEEVQHKYDTNQGLHFLTPPDVSEQLECSDDEARKLAAYAARACCHGILLPDSDGRSGWRMSLGKTLKHLRGEKHEP